MSHQVLLSATSTLICFQGKASLVMQHALDYKWVNYTVIAASDEKIFPTGVDR